MYLKSIEMVGFKSFAERTQLVFEPGMMAIVGPNGCGKSNVSDAIRWVLGEQSPKALRGAAMTDVIFNGTDTARPLAMAEVSLTFTDCEQTLGTDYHDVTVTRRVFRSGEGQYFLNRSPCRLRDIQRLFLDTGIGTSSYCVMEQGHIDLILSSRPDDRRAVFEEASGVARFKADRREALRKLDHTQANLDRADDVIRELSRQLVSLQRQAGKARRYKALRERLAALEAYLGRLRLASLDSSLAALDSSLAAKRAEEEKLKAEVEAAAAAAETLRADIAALETAIAAALDEAAAAKSRKAMAEERVRANRERVAELDTLFARDDAETQSAHAALALHAETLAALETEKAQTSAAAEAAAATDREKQAALASADAKTRTLRERLQQLRQEAVQLENVLARRQAELDQLEAASRSNRLRKERLLSEKDDAERAAAGFAERLASLAEEAAALEAKSAAASEALAAAEKKRQAHAAALAETQRAAAALQRSLSATQAKIDLVKGAKAAVGFPPGARKLLKDPRPAGTLADRVRAEKPFARALETALRPWLDALLCETPELALSLCGELAGGRVGSARFLFPAADEPPATPPGAGEPLLSHVKPAKAWAGVLSRLLSRVRVVPDAAAIPLPLAADGPDYVTRDGIFLSASGAAELFLPQADESNPLSLAEQRREWEAEVERLAAEEAEKRQGIASLEKELAASGKDAADARAAVDAARRDAARAEGGKHVVERERDGVLARAAAIARDLAALEKATGGEESRRAALAGAMEEKRTRLASARAETESGSAALSAAEEARAACVGEATEARVAALSLAQQRDAILARFAPLRARIGELNALVADRERAKEGYAGRKRALEEETARAVAGMPGLEAAEKAAAAALDEARKGRDEKRAALAGCDAETRALRGKYDEVRDARAAEEVRREHDAITRENLLGRLRSDWNLTPGDVAAAEEPDWKAVAGTEGRPGDEALDALAGELKEKIRLIGPVNLDSLSEAQEIEERYAFFTKQAKDLSEAKEKLVKLIGEIDATTKTLFEETFRKVNENFQDLFGRLFGGGQAHLALVDESNILESGIDIVAKPPGKKPQTVSLLSGGERTLTALALLFALFKVKPSPFCLTDELDAPLDETNITRYLDMLRSFLGTTQFLVITHSSQTIAAAKALYGVTMEKRGISKIVSVKFAEAIAEAKAEEAKTQARGKKA